MLDNTIKLWVALIAAGASLVVALVSHLSTRANQREIEVLKAKLSEETAEKDAKRDYQYEARKRLYKECGPILFQLTEICESAYFRISGLSETASRGYLTGPQSFLKSHYYVISTIYRLLAPSAVLKLLQRQLTLVDLSLDRTIYLQYLLARTAFFMVSDDFAFAQSSVPPLPYDPFNSDAEAKAILEPEIYRRQGLPLGDMDAAIESLIISNKSGVSRVITYAECEAKYDDNNSILRASFEKTGFLIEGFHPKTRPILWRMLVTQACVYRVLSQPAALARRGWNVADLRIPEPDLKKFDWRAPGELVANASVSEPFTVAEKYLAERLAPRLERMAQAS
jgi:hypothetical protein